jgi:hypothetical protein
LFPDFNFSNSTKRLFITDANTLDALVYFDFKHPNVSAKNELLSRRSKSDLRQIIKKFLNF